MPDYLVVIRLHAGDEEIPALQFVVNRLVAELDRWSEDSPVPLTVHLERVKDAPPG